MNPTPQAIEAAARRVEDAMERLGTLSATGAAVAALSGDLGDMVLVTKEALYEISHRAKNMGDDDAADWLPSIYRIACEAVGEDPWPVLTKFGFDRARFAAAQED